MSRRPGTGLTSTVTAIVPPPTEPKVIHRARGAHVSHPDVIMVVSVKKSGRSFIPRDRGPQRHWAHSGRSLCPACSPAASEAAAPQPQRPPPWSTLHTTPRAPPQDPGFTGNSFLLTSPEPRCGQVSLAQTARPRSILSSDPAPPWPLRRGEAS